MAVRCRRHSAALVYGRAHFWKQRILTGAWLLWITMEPVTHVRRVVLVLMGPRAAGVKVVVFCAPMLIATALTTIVWRPWLADSGRGAFRDVTEAVLT